MDDTTPFYPARPLPDWAVSVFENERGYISMSVCDWADALYTGDSADVEVLVTAPDGLRLLALDQYAEPAVYLHEWATDAASLRAALEKLEAEMERRSEAA